MNETDAQINVQATQHYMRLYELAMKKHNREDCIVALDQLVESPTAKLQDSVMLATASALRAFLKSVCDDEQFAAHCELEKDFVVVENFCSEGRFEKATVAVQDWCSRAELVYGQNSFRTKYGKMIYAHALSMLGAAVFDIELDRRAEAILLHELRTCEFGILRIELNHELAELYSRSDRLDLATLHLESAIADLIVDDHSAGLQLRLRATLARVHALNNRVWEAQSQIRGIQERFRSGPQFVISDTRRIPFIDSLVVEALLAHKAGEQLLARAIASRALTEADQVFKPNSTYLFCRVDRLMPIISEANEQDILAAWIPRRAELTKHARDNR
jgi:hypothetical protein